MDAGRFRGDFTGAAATRSLAIGSRFTSQVAASARTQRSVLPKSFGPRAASALVSQKLPPYLKLRASEPVDVVRPDVADLACLGELCQAFAEATGWPLRYVPEPESSEDIDLLWSAPVNPGVGVAPGHLRIDLSGTSAKEDGAKSDWHATERMAGAVAELVNELVAARHALWQREAELAAGVPVTAHVNEEGHLAARLEATLQAGAEAIQCDAAALYLLDEATSQLKLRAAWGMPIEKFIEPARPLANQMADLEALLGHAIALESRADMLGRWKAPEPTSSALCVPVSSPTTPVGTLWFFCQRERPFTDEQTNIAEVVAGKISSDLDRAVLLEQQESQKDLKTQVAAAARVQDSQSPAPPPIAGWNIGGWAEQSSSLGGAFYDWRMIDESSLLVLLGDTCEGGIDAALASASLKAALRIDDDDKFDLAKIAGRANRILWENSSGNWWAGLWLGQIQLLDGLCDYSSFGRPSGLLLRENGWASVIKPSEPLGLDPNMRVEKKQIILAPGEGLVVCNRGIMEACDGRGRPLGETAIAQTLVQNLRQPPEQMIDLVRNWLEREAWEPDRYDRSILAIKRLPG
jgi:sigma-B regulation protein RsbU (phosphoserine phosphatase)